MNNEPQTNEHSANPNKKRFTIHKLLMWLSLIPAAVVGGEVANNAVNPSDITTVTAESAHIVEKPEPFVSSINSVLPPTGQYEDIPQSQDLSKPYLQAAYNPETNPAPTSGETLVVPPDAQVINQLVPFGDQAALNEQLKYVEANLNDPVDATTGAEVNK